VGGNAECDGKYRFPSSKLASRGIRRSMVGRVYPYLCRVCGGWHVGSGSEPKSLRNKRPKEEEAE